MTREELFSHTCAIREFLRWHEHVFYDQYIRGLDPDEEEVLKLKSAHRALEAMTAEIERTLDNPPKPDR